jgi:hypothetical protein
MRNKQTAAPASLPIGSFAIKFCGPPFIFPEAEEREPSVRISAIAIEEA